MSTCDGSKEAREIERNYLVKTFREDYSQFVLEVAIKKVVKNLPQTLQNWSNLSIVLYNFYKETLCNFFKNGSQLKNSLLKVLATD